MTVRFSGGLTITQGSLGTSTPFSEPGIFEDALLWYDFSDESSVSLVNTNEISSVSNKGTHGGSIAPRQGSPSRFKYVTSSALGNNKVVDLDTNPSVNDGLEQVDDNLLSVNGSDMTYFAVINRTSLRGTYNFCLHTVKGNAGEGGYTKWEDYSQTYGSRDLTTVINRNGGSWSTYAIGSFVSGVDILAVRFDDTGNSLKYYRHINDTTYTFSPNKSITSDTYYQLCGVWYTTATLGQYQMGEFAMYPEYLDDTIFNEKLDLIKTKWNIT
jgi:hypothetical protein